MQTLRKNLALFIGGLLLAALMITSGATIFAAEVPAQPAATECTDCQTLQDNLDAAYSDLNELISQADAMSTQIEGLIDRGATNIYAGDTAMMVDNLNAQVTGGTLAMGSPCQDASDTFAYYSSFSYEGTTYCLLDEDMWYGVDPDYFNFFDHMMYLNEFWDPAAIADWQYLWDNWIEVLYDHDAGGEDGITELIDLIIQLLADLENCEDTNCPPVTECPDCETIADDLATALDDLDLLELEADVLDAELTDLETQIDDVLDQLAEWDTLRAEFEAMVEDAGGQHGSDCDDFEVQSGQAWGIAHNFGNVQWCFTNEGQIEDMIQNLDEYWQNHSSSHLPSEAALNAQLDTLMNDYFDALADYEAVLTEIEAQFAIIDGLMADLEACLDELEALQDLGECLDQDAAAMRDLLDDAAGTPGYTPEPPAEPEPEDESPEDIIGHWAEDFINELFNAGIVSGDGDTGNFRPNDELNRAEAAKMLLLGNGDTVIDSFFDVFFDVTEDDWFWPYVVTSEDLGYFEGYEDGSFGPGNSILRAEAIAVVMRALGFDIPEYTEYSFPDLTGDEWFADYAEKAFKCGVVAGREGMLEGGDTITRAEFSKIVDLALFNDLTEADCL
jgi:hypothetical protein